MKYRHTRPNTQQEQRSAADSGLTERNGRVLAYISVQDESVGLSVPGDKATGLPAG